MPSELKQEALRREQTPRALPLYSTFKVSVIDCGAEPGAVAVITRLYVPGGVAPDGPCGTLAHPAIEMANSAKAASGETTRSFRRCTPVTATIIAKASKTPSEGSHGPGRPSGGPNQGPSQEQKVFTVIIVAVVPGPRVTIDGAIEHVMLGCKLAQLSVTVPVNPFTDSRLNRKTAVSPGWTVAVVPPPGPGLNVKFTVPFRLKVAVTDWFEFIVTLHGPVPLHAPLQPAKVEFVAAVGVSMTIVPGAKLAEQAVGQLMPAGLLVTVPLPLPASVTISVKFDVLVLNVAVTA